MAEDIDRAFEERATLQDGGSVEEPSYEEFYARAAVSRWLSGSGSGTAGACWRLTAPRSCST